MIAIIGAGISGLYTAHLLKQRDLKVKIFEASDRALGRIHTLTTFASTPLELGAEFIHGKKSLLFNLASHSQDLVKTTFVPTYFYKNDHLTLRQMKKKRKPKQFIRFWKNLWNQDYDSLTLKQYLTDCKLYTASLQHIIEGFASEYGTSTDYLNLKALAQEENLWSAGESNYRLPKGFTSIFQPLIDELKADLIFKMPIDFINYWGEKVLIGSANKESFEAEKVVITVPLSVLKRKMIRFEPSLPSNKQLAIDTLGMGTGMKVILKFKNRFWKHDQTEIFGGWFCPLYYSSLDNPHLLIAYIMEQKAYFLSGFENHVLIKLLVEDLRLLFFQKSIDLDEAYILNWQDIPYIWGSYSYPTQNSLENRHILADSIDNKVFFAGEAVNTEGHASTVHGAIETAVKVADIITNSI